MDRGEPRIVYPPVYPFILRDLLFSAQMACAALLSLQSQNRRAGLDRIEAEHDYRVNQLALPFLIIWHCDVHQRACSRARSTLKEDSGSVAPTPNRNIDETRGYFPRAGPMGAGLGVSVS